MVNSWKGFIVAFLIAGTSCCFAQPEYKRPQDAAQALASATKVTLYSLDPSRSLEPQSGKQKKSMLHDCTILGKVELRNTAAKQATKAFQDAVFGWRGSAGACFDPHHALSVVSGGHTYDYLLCYSCGGMAIYKDGEFIAKFGASGSARILNKLLTANRVPLPYIYRPENIAAEKARK